MKCWTGKLQGRNYLLAAKSKQRAAEILKVPLERIKKFKSTPLPSWVKDEVVYVLNSGNWEERID